MKLDQLNRIVCYLKMKGIKIEEMTIADFCDWMHDIKIGEY